MPESAGEFLPKVGRKQDIKKIVVGRLMKSFIVLRLVINYSKQIMILI